MERYSRNILIEGFGAEGQEKLKRAKILVVGAGGLGSPVLLYLAASGVGTLGIVDYDRVDVSNLQRQIIHFTSDVGCHKTDSAAEKLRLLAPDICIQLHNEPFDVENAVSLVDKYDFVIDCCDNFDTKYLINDICVQQKKPYSHGSVVGMRGEVMTYLPGYRCYRSFFETPPNPPEACTSSKNGILGAVAGIVGSIQATEAIKYLVGMGELLVDKLLVIDGRTMRFTTLSC